MRSSKTRRLRKKRSKERNRKIEEEARNERSRNAVLAYLRPARRRRLRGIGSRGIDLKIHFDEKLEIPFDPDDPVGSVERARDLGEGWDKTGYPTAGDA